MLYYISRLAKKMHINKVVYVLLAPFYHSEITCNEKELEKAKKTVTAFHPDSGSSCIADNRLDICHDLQIIIAAYNVEQYIEECLDSVLNQQTDVDYICTIVNDGSTDGTYDIIRKYAGNPRVEVINQQNKGQSGARNTALKTLKGKYIMFLDSDDKLTNGSLNALMNMALETKADIVEGGYRKFTNKGDILYTYKHQTQCDVTAGDLYGFPWGKLFKAEMFEKLKFPEKYWFEDTLMAMVLFPMAKKIATVDAQVYEYRINPKGISSTAPHSPKALDSYWIMLRLMKDRLALGLVNDDRMADFIVNSQIPINERRMGLCNKNIRKAVFVLSMAFMHKYFPDYIGTGCFRFLKNRDYQGLRLYSLFRF